MTGRIEGQTILADPACLTRDGKLQWEFENNSAITHIGDLTLSLPLNPLMKPL